MYLHPLPKLSSSVSHVWFTSPGDSLWRNGMPKSCEILKSFLFLPLYINGYYIDRSPACPVTAVENPPLFSVSLECPWQRSGLQSLKVTPLPQRATFLSRKGGFPSLPQASQRYSQALLTLYSSGHFAASHREDRWISAKRAHSAYLLLF